MKRGRFYLLLGAEFIALTALAALTADGSGLVTSVMAFPLEQVGAGLRALSLAGRVGNGLALALWAALGLLPLPGVWKHRGDKSRRWKNLSLCCLAALLLCVLPAMVNPGRLCAALACTEAAVKMLLGGTVWSVAVLWAVLRLLRLFRAGDTQTLLVYLRRTLYVLCGLFTGAASLGVVSAAVAGMNVAQLALVRWSSDVSVSVTIPVMSLAFLLAVLLASRLIAENRRLRDDNDLFI